MTNVKKIIYLTLNPVQELDLYDLYKPSEEKKYSMAEYCFKHCEALIHQNEMSSYKYLSIVLYNISLCFFYTKKYEKCYKIWVRL